MLSSFLFSRLPYLANVFATSTWLVLIVIISANTHREASLGGLKLNGLTTQSPQKQENFIKLPSDSDISRRKRRHKQAWREKALREAMTEKRAL